MKCRIFAANYIHDFANDMSFTKQALPQGAVLRGKKEYRIEKVLGNGGFGITYLATSTFMDGNIRRRLHYTIKEFFMSSLCSRDEQGAVVFLSNDDSEVKQHMLSFQKEAEHLQSLKHPNIVPVNEMFRANNTFYYVMEFLGNLSLTQYVEQQGGRLTEEQAKPIILALADALGALHDQQMNHLDVKPDNVMMMEGEDGLQPVLIDFGLSKHYNRSGKMTMAFGTTGVSHGYSPLEQYAGVESFAPQLDIYALGAALFYLLTGKTPCKSAEISDAYLKEQLPAGLSEPMRKVVMTAMKKDAADRTASISEFIAPLKGNTNEKPAAASNETVVISAPGKKAKPKSSFNMAALIKPLIAVVAVLVLGVGGYLVAQNLPEGSVEEKQEGQSENVMAPAETEAQQAVQQTVDDKEKVLPQQEATPSTPASTQSATVKPETPKVETSSKPSKGLDLGYAQWDGDVVKGKADGTGTMRFTKSHDLGNGRTAEPGDYIKGNYYEGVLESGKWYSADGTLKETIIQ